jgi:hypothetical protein
MATMAARFLLLPAMTRRCGRGYRRSSHSSSPAFTPHMRRSSMISVAANGDIAAS